MELILIPIVISALLFVACLMSAAFIGKALKFFGMSILSLIGVIGFWFAWSLLAPESLMLVLSNLPFVSDAFNKPYGNLIVEFVVIQLLPGIASIIAWLMVVPFHQHSGMDYTGCQT